MKLLKTLFTIAIINLVAVFIFTLKLPDIVPSHVNYLGEIDGYSSKWLVPFGLVPIILLVTAMVYRKQTDSGKVRNNQKVESIIFPILGVLFIGLSWLPVYMGLQTEKFLELPIDALVGLPLGILMIILGNYMGIIKYNKTLGIRTPWTLKNEQVWQKTHRKGAYWSVWAGFIIIFSSLLSYFTGQKLVFMIGFFIAIFLLAVLPIAYSYVIYKKLK